MVVISYFVVTRYFWTLKTRILKYLMQMLPDSVIRLLMPTTQPVAAVAANDDA
jgi:hypothetical protein